jgi:hypothetical protein
VVDYLEDRGVDTSGIRERQIQLENYHVRVEGSVEGSLAVGQGSTAKVEARGKAGTGGR